ncbi:hypothetical protein PAHAL_7G038900 [Panicum hallii]|jgi:hypothetical protein|uniref:H(+)/Pi cotransporter n=1 Tax=Panicum hallii TaxID=206008 RepID=A0A2T8IAV9_9POAL|nr:uncharacterized protein LOC112899236 [Panicum hallii]PVH34807.1 hypothetical protein PAHAL_7G038900 [Panicum hallii]
MLYLFWYQNNEPVSFSFVRFGVPTVASPPYFEKLTATVINLFHVEIRFSFCSTANKLTTIYIEYFQFFIFLLAIVEPKSYGISSIKCLSVCLDGGSIWVVMGSTNFDPRLVKISYGLGPSLREIYTSNADRVGPSSDSIWTCTIYWRSCSAFMLGLAIPYHHWTTPGNHVGFVVMYTFTFFFTNFGPNSTTFIVPAEIFPARLRSTCHGISSAAGKSGAIVGSFGSLYAAQSTDPTKTDAGYPPGIGVRNSLFMLSGCNVVVFLFTFLVPESKGKSLEELSVENEDEAPPASGQSNKQTAPTNLSE